VDLGQVPPGDVEIPRGRVDGAVAQQEVDRVQIPPGFQPRRGTAMAQRLEACAVGDPGDSLSVGVSTYAKEIWYSFPTLIKICVKASLRYSRPK
jgi:hypothetical protein